MNGITRLALCGAVGAGAAASTVGTVAAMSHASRPGGPVPRPVALGVNLAAAGVGAAALHTTWTRVGGGSYASYGATLSGMVVGALGTALLASSLLTRQAG